VMGEHRNRLSLEKSPYLLQHARNPVDWYPWGEEAFVRAKADDRPVFLSIGYSTCHWCHVMERESFEDAEIARLMNETFVSIKVDREERPDVDSVYMAVCQMMNGTGGWPLTIIMTPDKEPFFAATYVPRESRFGQTGMMQLVPRVGELWDGQRDRLLDSARRATAALRSSSVATGGGELGEAVLHLAYRQLRERFDEEHGGFGNAPKFPTPHNLLFLLRYWKRTGSDHALAMVQTTLRNMRRGGIYDHLGYGFHRYSTDRQWLVPHFEKMLYDQALLVMACAEAFQATGKEEYSAIARETLEYVLRDMTAPEGGFYSAEDADSEGEEGRFYTWTRAEIREALPAQDARVAEAVFGIRDSGNYPGGGGRNILHLAVPVHEVAGGLGMTEEELLERMRSVRVRLLARRSGRERPARDTKVLVDWNGLMVSALAKAARAFGEPGYAAAAGKAVDFILDHVRRDDGRLLHRYCDGEAGIDAQLDDYAFLVQGLLDLYEATFDVRHLEVALEMNEQLLAHFWDEVGGGFFLTADDGEELLVRQKEVYDGAIPSGNSVAMLNLLRLAHITGNQGLAHKAAAIGRVFSERVRQLPSAYTQLLAGLDFALGPVLEVVVAGEGGAADTAHMLRAAQSVFVPNKVVVFRPAGEETAGIERIAPFTAACTGIGGVATAYVCFNHACRLPTNDVGVLLEQLLRA